MTWLGDKRLTRFLPRFLFLLGHLFLFPRIAIIIYTATAQIQGLTLALNPGNGIEVLPKDARMLARPSMHIHRWSRRLSALRTKPSETVAGISRCSGAWLGPNKVRYAAGLGRDLGGPDYQSPSLLTLRHVSLSLSLQLSCNVCQIHWPCCRSASLPRRFLSKLPHSTALTASILLLYKVQYFQSRCRDSQASQGQRGLDVDVPGTSEQAR